MIRQFSLTALILLGCATVAQAATDSRIRSQAYDANEIVKIVGKAGIQSTIEFADDERIENVAVGDSSKWQITPNRRASLLFVKPLSAGSHTNMTVVTDRRTYMFDLVSGEKSSAAVYALKFTYPNEKPVESATKPVQQAVTITPQQQAVATAEKLHFDWNKKGAGKLLPARVFDDGSSLFLAWDKSTPLPAILTMSEDKQEGPVNYRMSGEYIVVSPIPQNLVLRYGRASAALWPSRRITPVAPAPAPARVAGTVAIAAVSAPPPAKAPDSSVKLANVTALYSDQLTDTSHEH